MHRFLSLSRLLLPAAFLAYALAANVAVIRDEWASLSDARGHWLNGEIAGAFGGHYEAALPHRSVAEGLLGAARYVLAGEGRDGVAVGRGGWLFTAEETRPASRRDILRAVHYVTAVDRRLAARGVTLVVVPVPAKIDIIRRAAPDWLPVAAMARQYRRFHDALARRGIATVDARAALRAADSPARPAFLRTDTHWTPSGAAAVAQAVAQAGHVPPGRERFRRVPEPETVFAGDLVRFVTTETMAPRIGLAPETVLPWVAEAAGAATGGIFAADAAPPDTVLVGTSYSANPAWSFGPALSVALGRNVLNLAEEGLGPIRPMDAFLDRLEAGETPPATVIWEFPVRYLADPGIWIGQGDTLASAGTGGPLDG